MSWKGFSLRAKKGRRSNLTFGYDSSKKRYLVVIENKKKNLHKELLLTPLTAKGLLVGLNRILSETS